MTRIAFPAENLDVGRHLFRLRQLDFDGGVHVSPEVEVEIKLNVPARVSLVYPTPSTSAARLSGAVQVPQVVMIALYAVLGSEVGRVVVR